ncbi:MAG: hypothetical protein EZS28_036009 [Streblomastix strix]|uniref:Uncharacterized protein n=1 Tax=Streblomastix strix TaxID=222440 RepID=A0A5J4UE19_9EUKA|nr:MAG: hypothetical protein EZS28_036009 [Streblomastix strix]
MNYCCDYQVRNVIQFDDFGKQINDEEGYQSRDGDESGQDKRPRRQKVQFAAIIIASEERKIRQQEENDREKGDDIRKKRKFSEIENKKKKYEDESEEGNQKSRLESDEDLEENKEREKEMELEYAEVGLDGLQDELVLLKECVDEYCKNELKGRRNRKKNKIIQKNNSNDKEIEFFFIFSSN